jgi:hypothetical protein
VIQVDGSLKEGGNREQFQAGSRQEVSSGYRFRLYRPATAASTILDTEFTIGCRSNAISAFAFVQNQWQSAELGLAVSCSIAAWQLVNACAALTFPAGQIQSVSPRQSAKTTPGIPLTKVIDAGANELFRPSKCRAPNGYWLVLGGGAA